ncbi:hypothetical protein [Pontibacter sp. G13]|uniref:hypothetical protein n=1 Tax=Pontibacter sp. G13 TaxID=3074898 RepID=UPI00288C42C9|nr:hypothetical protein [Pontibacter sp. G13]WNJ19967.1 hypothetical protein RJD25_05745 [Pontibacter sp. G13]
MNWDLVEIGIDARFDLHASSIKRSSKRCVVADFVIIHYSNPPKEFSPDLKRKRPPSTEDVERE